jgi:hypothetical protein
MRILSFILAFGFVCAAPGFNATAESHLPGAGAFTYSGSLPANNTAVAHLTLTTRGKPAPVVKQGDAREITSTIARG